jgi:hypothetical protein
MAAAACLLGLSASATPALAGGTTGVSGPIFGEYGECLDLNFANPANGTLVHLYPCNNTAAQQWEIEPGPAGDTIHATAVENPSQGIYKCLDVAGGGTNNGTLVQIWDCNGTVNQTWTPLPNGNLVNPNSGKCLDVPNGVAGPQLQIWDCVPTTAHQYWEIPGQRRIAAGPVLDYSNGTCMDDRNGGTAPGNPVQIYTCTGGNNSHQQWTVKPGPTGDTISARSLGNFCLGVAAAGGNGTLVGLYPCGGTTDLWVPLPNGELVNTISGRCLDDPNGSTTNLTQLQIWDCGPVFPSHQSWTTPLLSSTP